MIIRIFKSLGLKTLLVYAYNMTVKFFRDFYNFNIKIACYNFRGNFANAKLLGDKFTKYIKHKRDTYVYKYLETDFYAFIKGYKNKYIDGGKNSKKIWCCWWQGEKSSPDIVKICINSIREKKSGYDVVVIDKDNYSDYIQLPKYIIEKNRRGNLSITHLSDIIRFGLLSKYGGIWIDSTIFVNSDIFKEFDNINFNSYYPVKTIKKDHGFTKWCGFFIGGETNRLFSFVYDFYLLYRDKYDNIINYFLMDYIILLAYNNFQDVREDINNVTLIDNDDKLMDFIGISAWFNEEYKEDDYKKVMGHGFIKLSYKSKFIKETPSGKLTNYGKFTQENTIYFK